MSSGSLSRFSSNLGVVSARGVAFHPETEVGYILSTDAIYSLDTILAPRAPVAMISAVDADVTISCSAVPGATRYRYRAGSAPNVAGDGIIDNGRMAVFENRQFGATFYAEWAAGTDEVWGPWSAKVSVRIRDAITSAVPTFTLSAERDVVTVVVNPVSNAETYTYRFATSQAALAGAGTIAILPSVDTTETLQFGTTYYFQVRSRSTEGAVSAWSAVQSVTTPSQDQRGTLTPRIALSGRNYNFAITLADADGVRGITSAILTARDGQTADITSDWVTTDANTRTHTDSRRNARWASGSISVTYVDGAGNTATLTGTWSV